MGNVFIKNVKILILEYLMYKLSVFDCIVFLFAFSKFRGIFNSFRSYVDFIFFVLFC